MACSIFMIAWNARRFIDNNYLLFIGIAYLFVGTLDFVHMLAYTGMGPLGSEAGPNLPTQVWVASRSVEAASLLVAPFFLGRSFRPWVALVAFGGLTALLLASIFAWQVFPTAYVAGEGLTGFKVYSEYAICGALVVAGGLLHLKRRHFDERVQRLLLGSVGATIASELLFTLYTSPFGTANLLGHFLKVVSFYLIYKAIIETGLVQPYGLLFRNLKRSEDRLEERVRDRTLALEQEIERRREVEERLRRSEERFRTLVENAHDMIFHWRLNPDLQVGYVSPSAETVTGYSREEFYSDPHLVTRMVHPEDRQALEAVLHDPESGRGPHVLRWRRKDGETTWVELTAVPLLDGDGRRIAVQGIARDITERRRAERRIMAYQKQLRSLASELLLAEERERRRIAADLHDGVGQMLAAARIKLAALLSSASDADLDDSMREVQKLIDQTIRDTRTLTFEISPPVLYELGLGPALEWLTEQVEDRYGIEAAFRQEGGSLELGEEMRVLLFRAARELVHNVTKHAQAERVRVHLRRDGPQVSISVRDDGVGFDTSVLEGHREDREGFGLFNIRERLNHLGGDVHIESRPGEGTHVTMSAPLATGETARETG